MAGVRAGIAAALLGLGGACAQDPSVAPPNLLLISIDTLRADVLGCYGSTRNTSPTIDRLAREGTRFADCSSTAPWTLPAHASLLTGTYPTTHGVKNHERRLDPAHATLATRLLDRGFETRAIVNSHHLGDPRYGLQEGFRETTYIAELDASTRTVANCGEEVNARAAAALASMRQPFFLFLHYYDAHTAYRAGEPYDGMFVEPYDGPMKATTRQLSRYRIRGQDITGRDGRFLRQRYEAEVRRVDDLVEVLLARLDELGLAENTIVVLTSDHGEEFGERGGAMHGRSQYQEVLHVPLIIKGPGLATNRVVQEPVSLIDVAPTILGALDPRDETGFEGIDLSGTLRGEVFPAVERLLFAEADHENWIDRKSYADVVRMVRLGRAKLCYNEVLDRFELFDLELDPAELHDRLAEEPELARRLKRELRRFAAREQGGIAIPPPGAEQQKRLDDMGY
jgi:arylsulfatase A-like enzyme